jgi:sec-independent protein translocase protein TatA
MLSSLENPVHLLFLFLIILLLFGAKRLPELGRGLGTGMRDFKHALTQPQVPDPPLEPSDRSPQSQPSSAADRRVDGANAPHDQGQKQPCLPLRR